jgi:hypothetical protein
VSAFYIQVNGGGAISIDHIVVGREF